MLCAELVAVWQLGHGAGSMRWWLCTKRPYSHCPIPRTKAHLSHALLPCRQAPSMSIESSWGPHSALRIHCSTDTVSS